MRYWLLILLSLCFSTQAGGPVRPAPAPGGPGSIGPSVVLRDVNGDMFYLNEYCGKKLKYPWKNKKKYIVILDFWERRCEPCIKEIPLLEALAARYPGHVKLFLINLDKKDPRMLLPFIKESKFTSPIIIDRYGRTADRYGVKAVPSLFVLDQEGYIRHSSSGYNGPGDVETLARVIAGLVEAAQDRAAGSK